MEEQAVWKGRSSEVVNLGAHVTCLLGSVAFILLSVFFESIYFLIGLIFCAAFSLWKKLVNRFRVYEITTERIKVTTGIFSRNTEELELYRVKDTRLVEPFLQRLFSAGNVVLMTTDLTSPRLTVEAVKNAGQLRETLRKNIESCRARKRVLVAETEQE